MLAKPVKEQMGDNFKLNKSHQMQIVVRLHGFKELSKAVFAINTEPSDTISSIARKLQEIAGVPADRLTMLSGLALNNPSGSFKKLDGSGTVADQGLCHGSTVMAFVPVGHHDSSDALVAPLPQCKRRSICVGKVHYRPSPSQPLKSGDIMAVAEVVRDLYRSERQPEQSYSERQLFEQALDRMAREIAAVKKIDDDQAVKELEEYLSKNAKRAPTGEKAEEDVAADEAA